MMSLKQFTQQYDFKKIFIHIDISTFWSALLLLLFFCLRLCMWVTLYICPCMPLHKHASVKIHMLVNVAHVLKHDQFCSFIDFFLYSLDRQNPNKPTNKQTRKKVKDADVR